MPKSRTLVDSDIQLVKNRMRKVDQLPPHLKMCLYARNKVGKTQFAGSSTLDTFLIDCNEKGTDSISDRSNVTVFEIPKFDDIDAAYWYLKASNHPHKVVVIDTMSMLAKLAMKHVLKEDLEKTLDREPPTPDKRSWGKVGQLLDETTMRFRNLPMHVLFLAQERRTTSDDDEGGTTIEIGPDLSPAPRATLQSAVSLIGRLYVKEVEKDDKTTMQRRMLTGAHPKYTAGNRFKQLKYVEVNPNLEDFLTRIYGEHYAD